MTHLWWTVSDSADRDRMIEGRDRMNVVLEFVDHFLNHIKWTSASTWICRHSTALSNSASDDYDVPPTLDDLCAASTLQLECE
jgi:hypothetical protein